MGDSQDLLVQQILPSLDQSSAVPQNYGIRRALRMLFDIGVGDTPPIAIRSSPDGDALRRSRPLQKAIAIRGDPRIYINDWTRTFQDATKGRTSALQDLAAVIAHETVHAKQRQGEGPAYDEQIRVLNLLGAPRSLIRQAEEARAYVLQGRR